MTGRGIDQVLPHPSDPVLYEPYVRDARDYVRLAEEANGAIPAPVALDYIWGDALAELRRADVRIANLETSITRSDEAWPEKGIHYRMHPLNIGCLSAADIDCCSLANNHVLDWGYAGLEETLRTLDAGGVARAGAGRRADEAAANVTLEIPPKGRVLVVALGSPTSGIPHMWGATAAKPGINLLNTLSEKTAAQLAGEILRITQPDDLTVVSIHWGGNWGYAIPDEQIEFARRLADEGIDVVHGHSSHHAKAIEVRHGRLILYGCGDFITDYEGISGYEEFRGDLAVLYRVRIVPQPRRLVEVRLVPFRMNRFRLTRASTDDARLLATLLGRECARFSTEVQLLDDGSLVVTAR